MKMKKFNNQSEPDVYQRVHLCEQQSLTAGTTQFIGKDIPVTKASYNGRGGWVDLILVLVVLVGKV